MALNLHLLIPQMLRTKNNQIKKQIAKALVNPGQRIPSQHVVAKHGNENKGLGRTHGEILRLQTSKLTMHL